jgi:hypothetical protein
MPSALAIDELLALARQHSRAEFAARLPHRFLVVDEVLKDEEPVAFSTQAWTARKHPSRPAPHPRVFEIRKAPGNPYPDRIAVGRTRNCDVVLRDSSVSKLHAHFRLGDNGLELVDLGSRNGTRVGYRRLIPYEPTPVSDCDTVTFGNVSARILDAARLHDVLCATSGTTSPA